MLKRFFLFALAILLLGSQPLRAQARHFSLQDVSLKTVDYKLDLDIDFKDGKIAGDCQLTVSNPGPQPVEKIPLILYRLMKVTAAKDGHGANLTFRQQVLAFEDWDKLQVNFIEVSLKSPIRKGERRTVEILYDGYLCGYSEAMQYVKDHVDIDFTIIRTDSIAYPEVGVPSWKANRATGLQAFDYMIKVKVPESLAVANGGKLAAKSERDGFVTYVYQNLRPAWRIDAAIAKYDLLEDIPNSLRVFHFQKDKDGARAVLQALRDAFELYKRWFGPLDGTPEYSLIEVPEGYGSQADVTSILLTRDSFLSKDNLTDLYHEIAHRWDVTARDPLPSRFESEGRAMFLQYLVQEKLENKKGALEEGVERACRSFRKQCQPGSKGKDVPMIDYGKEDLTDLSYSKGMVFFYLLYKLAGEKELLDTLGSFHRKYGPTGATTEDFLIHLKQNLKIDLTKLLQDWVYGATSSDYLINKIPIDQIVKKYLQTGGRSPICIVARILLGIGCLVYWRWTTTYFG